MPIYEYECRSCGVHFDRKQRWHDEPVKHCPQCQGEVRKVMQPVGIVFKGPGFYKTDNNSSGARQERQERKAEEDKASGGDKEAKAPAGPDSQASAKADAKPDSRSEPKSGPDSSSNVDTKSESKVHSKSGESSQDHQPPR